MKGGSLHEKQKSNTCSCARIMCSHAYRLCGLSNPEAERGYSDTMKRQMEIWTTYESSGKIQNDVTSQLSPEDATAYSSLQSDWGTLVVQWFPQYIMGTYDVEDDAAWQNFCDEVDALGWQSSQEALQAVVDRVK